jgi:hypothetical protein
MILLFNLGGLFSFCFALRFQIIIIFYDYERLKKWTWRGGCWLLLQHDPSMIRKFERDVSFDDKQVREFLLSVKVLLRVQKAYDLLLLFMDRVQQLIIIDSFPFEMKANCAFIFWRSCQFN